MRIGPGNWKKHFQCRNLHDVRDIPDPTQHFYIPIKYQLQKTTVEVLEDIVMYIPSSNENENLPSRSFTHQYFTPKWHIPPCNYNAKFKFSPVITDFYCIKIHAKFPITRSHWYIIKICMWIYWQVLWR